LLTGALLSRFTDSSLDMSPTFIGKGTTLVQLLYIILIIVFTSRHLERQLLHPLLYLMVGLTVSSGLHYLYRGVAHLNTREA
jgi:cardiolipin synthase (CMP-forming)